jgi:DNA polymerase III epsilon subunit-like protein
MDCEMCRTSAQKNEVTRVSVVNEQEEVVFDSLVKPKNPIIDYLTQYSGITKKMLDPVTTSLRSVNKKLRKILPEDAILVGQSLNFDLSAMGLIHPYVIDTSVIYNLSGVRGIKSGLKTLMYEFLGEEIQNKGKAGHCSVEDSAAAMKLVKLKLENGMEYGDRVLGGSAFATCRSGRSTMTIMKYMDLKDLPFNVYYNFVASDDDPYKRTINIFDGPEMGLKKAIISTASKTKAICVVLTADGLCYIRC